MLRSERSGREVRGDHAGLPTPGSMTLSKCKRTCRAASGHHVRLVPVQRSVADPAHRTSSLAIFLSSSSQGAAERRAGAVLNLQAGDNATWRRILRSSAKAAGKCGPLPPGRASARLSVNCNIIAESRSGRALRTKISSVLKTATRHWQLRHSTVAGQWTPGGGRHGEPAKGTGRRANFSAAVSVYAGGGSPPAAGAGGRRGGRGRVGMGEGWAGR